MRKYQIYNKIFISYNKISNLCKSFIKYQMRYFELRIEFSNYTLMGKMQKIQIILLLNVKLFEYKFKVVFREIFIFKN